MHRLKLKQNPPPSIIEHQLQNSNHPQNRQNLNRLTSIVKRFEKYAIKHAEQEFSKLIGFFTKKLTDFAFHHSNRSLEHQELDSLEDKLEMLYVGFNQGLSDVVQSFLEVQYSNLTGETMNDQSRIPKWDYSSFNLSYSGMSSNYSTSMVEQRITQKFSKKKEVPLIEIRQENSEFVEEEYDLNVEEEYDQNIEEEYDQDIELELELEDADLGSGPLNLFKNKELKDTEDIEISEISEKKIRSKTNSKPKIENKKDFSSKFSDANKMQSHFIDFQTTSTLLDMEKEQTGALSQITPRGASMFTKGDKSLQKLLGKMDTFLIGLNAEIELAIAKKGIQTDHIELCGSQRTENWFKARSCRLTSSNFGKVFHRKSFKSMEKFVNSFFKRFNSDKIPALKYGTETEEKAFARYQQGLRSGEKAIETGFWVNRKYPWLGGSPDGFKIYGKGKMRSLEIKCPYNGRDLEIEELYEMRSKKGKFFLIEDENLKISVNPNHNYMCQIQGVMEIVGTQDCDFIVYTSKDFYVTTEKKNEEYIAEMFAKLKMAYFRFLLPNFCRRDDYDSEMPAYKEISQEIYEKKYK